ncbi:MAG TPA: hypothetical protein PKH08_03990 [Clostridia bacterium]|jgi:amino acid transporter|nr:hypothetical protein [Clostridia bacterium]HOK82176.1 hypothetical protein [Clostridia bacterium]HOL61185.1 hypothetical protein [Clostridia bacterium]HPO53841.1 hypothetical protein [Clostridia bacterium]
MNTMLSAFADNLKNTVKALDITWKGMLGIFLVIGIIYIVVTVLNIVTVEDKRKAVAQKIKGFFKKK